MKGHYGYKSAGYWSQLFEGYLLNPNRCTIAFGYGRPAKLPHENKLVDHIFETVHQNDSKKSFLGGDIDDLFQDRLGLILSRIELILLLSAISVS